MGSLGNALYERLSRLPLLELADATQMFLWVYCTLDVLPEELRVGDLSTESLIEIFEELTRNGKISNFPENVPGQATGKTDFWSDLPRKFLSGEILLDETFRPRLHVLLSSDHQGCSWRQREGGQASKGKGQE